MVRLRRGIRGSSYLNFRIGSRGSVSFDHWSFISDYPDPFSVDDHSPGHQSDHFPTSSVVLGSARLLDMVC